MWWDALWAKGIHPVQLAAAVVGGTVAAVLDLRSRRIPNALTLPMWGLGLLWSGWFAGPAGLADGFTASIVLAVPYVALFLLAGGGAGDAKMMASLGAWAGVVHGLIILVSVALAGAVGGVVWALVRGRGTELFDNLVWIIVMRRNAGERGHAATPHPMQAMPYGLAIAAGVWVWGAGALLWPS